MKKTCCPQYTIRLDTTRFAISKSQKKSRRKVERFLEGSLTEQEMKEVADDDEMADSEEKKPGEKKQQEKPE